MKSIFVFMTGCVVLHLIECRPAEIVLQTNNQDGSGQFIAQYRLDDGTGEEKYGKLMPNNNGQDSVLVQHGSYTTNIDGKLITYNWVADTRGYRVSKA
ncbi:endocuticle structural glycoprotein SgAbd-5-like [Daktulosphaira vitifoliae]|uniref:endocuticle structural glycoprotein SgAbd-5-like n=1 Tax=Daktulosphaira vitifoliae TaxID=58002 RepID=UPI0021AAF99A|nr:endocuticle structural glycoprotein SgAbd-5-like [Daktulosphaira vitifoliae]